MTTPDGSGPETGSLAEAMGRDGDPRLRSLIDRVLAFVGVLTPEGILLEANEPAVAAAGVPRSELVGRPFWDCHWWSFDAASQDRLRAAVAEAATGRAVRYDTQVRVGPDDRIWIDFQIVPILDAEGRVREMVPSGVDITERKRAEENRELLLQELSHRVKNTLASIDSMAGQTLRHAETPGAFREAFGARLRAIAASHDLLVASNHQNVPLGTLVRGQVSSFAGDPAALRLSGPDVLLPGDAAHSLGLILHELATNAAKYGALSVPGGAVEVSWSVEDGALALDWRERGGPSVEAPARRGFGTRLIDRTSGDEGATFDFAPEGLRVSLTMPLA